MTKKENNPMPKEIVFPLSHYPKYSVPVGYHFVKFPLNTVSNTVNKMLVSNLDYIILSLVFKQAAGVS